MTADLDALLEQLRVEAGDLKRFGYITKAKLLTVAAAALLAAREETATARGTAEYWKAEHNSANAALDAALADIENERGLRAVVESHRNEALRERLEAEAARDAALQRAEAARRLAESLARDLHAAEERAERAEDLLSSANGQTLRAEAEREAARRIAEEFRSLSDYDRATNATPTPLPWE
jgi:hypothetical protein